MIILMTSIIIAIATVVYAYFTYRQLKESEATRLQKITPFIVAFLKSTDNHKGLSLHIKNIGEGLAKNVKIEILKDYHILGMEKYRISNLNIMKNGINIFPPQYEFVNNVDFMENLFLEKEENVISLSITYEGIDGRKYYDVYDLPFNQYIGQHYCNPPATYMGEISYYLKEINNTIKKVNSKN